MPSKIIFTPEMDKRIHDLIGTMSINDIAKCIGVSEPTMRDRVKRLKLWGFHLAYLEDENKKRKPVGNNFPESKVSHYKGGKQKSFYCRRVSEEGKKEFWRWAQSLGYDIRHSSKVVFATSKTKKNIRFVQRLRNEFPEYKLKDLSTLSNLKYEED